jgi:hypothetical protein
MSLAYILAEQVAILEAHPKDRNDIAPEISFL